MEFTLTHRKQKLSEAQEFEVCSRYQAGEDSRHLSRCFGVCPATILNILKRGGVTTRKAPSRNLDKSAIFASYQSGLTTRQVAANYGICRKTCSAILSEFGVRTRLTLEDKQSIGELYKQGKTLSEIGERFLCDPKSCGNALRALGIPLRKGTPPPKELRIGLKECVDCKKYKSLGEFSPNKKAATGTMPKCRECSKAYLKTWRKENPDMVRAQWRQSGAVKRTRWRNASGKHTKAQWDALCKRYGDKCLCCGAKGLLTRDHITPLSCGGGNDISNIQPLCLNCNVLKGINTTDYRPED